MLRTYSFQVEVYGDVISGSAMPIYDHETELLAGGFNVMHGNLITCFLSGHGYPLALQVSSGGSFYLTPIMDKRDQVCGAYVSMQKLGPLSVNVPYAEPGEEQ
jgi:hypothetical protein